MRSGVHYELYTRIFSGCVGGGRRWGVSSGGLPGHPRLHQHHEQAPGVCLTGGGKGASVCEREREGENEQSVYRKTTTASAATSPS